MFRISYINQYRFYIYILSHISVHVHLLCTIYIYIVNHHMNVCHFSDKGYVCYTHYICFNCFFPVIMFSPRWASSPVIAYDFTLLPNTIWLWSHMRTLSTLPNCWLMCGQTYRIDFNMQKLTNMVSNHCASKLLSVRWKPQLFVYTSIHL